MHLSLRRLRWPLSLTALGLLTALVCAVDGAVVASMVGDGDGPRATARATLVDVLDVLAPYDAVR